MMRISSVFIPFSVLLLGCAPPGSDGVVFLHQTVEVIRSETSRSILAVEVASTDSTRERGLMFREHMDENQGMLFVWPQSGVHGFWMKNTRIPLDMLFIRKGRVVAIIPWARPMDETPLDAGVESDSVLEVNGGWAARTNTTLGARIEVKEIK